MSIGPAHDRDSWREVIDLDALTRWMDKAGLGHGSIERPRPLGGGTQNILIAFERGADTFVLRRPPLHLRPESNETMRREAVVLAALRGSQVPHPALVAAEADPAILGATFYLMRPVDGFTATEGLPALHAGSAHIRRGMGEALVDGAIALSRVDPGQSGLSDLGRLDGWLERQVPRWRKQLEGYAQFDRWPGLAALPDIEAICRWLEEHRPAQMKPGLVHGDYHLANVMFRHDSPALAAIVDWELASRGDPLLDLGWIAATWPDPAEPVHHLGVKPWDGFPPIGDLIERYLSATGRTASDAHWFEILACFKLGAILEGSYARACAGLTPAAVGERLHAHATTLFERAHRRIARPVT